MKKTCVRTRAARVAVPLLATLAVVLTPAVGSACGGFFCSSVPIDQAGEHILFAVDGTTVTAHIQIQYTGESEKFSWVVPLPSVPTLSVGTDVLFQRLRQMTDPRFNIEWEESSCKDVGQPCLYDASESAPSGGGGGGDNGVVVLDAGEVGSFDYQVVEGDGDALYAWLNDNGYDQDPNGKPIVKYYANQSYKFVALKLKKGKQTGEITPLVARFESPTLACVPLKLTAIAATPNMPVYTWVLAESRAVPMNFFHVTLNPKAYPWLKCAQGGGYGGFGGYNGSDCQQAYVDLVTKAADAANGHAFVTEFAGSASLMDKQVYTDGQFNTDTLAAVSDPIAFLSAMLQQGLPRNPLMQEIIRTWIPKPEPSMLPDGCQSDQEFYTWNAEECFKSMPSDWTFDPAGMAADIQERIVAPMEEAQKLFGAHHYLTRFFTTISPDEMTKDPMFSFNPDLPDVSQNHSVKAKLLCPNDPNTVTGAQITFPNGETETVSGTVGECQGFIPEDDSSPLDGNAAYSEIQVLSESGGAETVPAGDVASREPGIETRTPDPEKSKEPQRATPGTGDNAGTFGNPRTSGTPSTAGGSGGGSSSGCSQTAHPARGAMVLLFSLAMLLVVGLRRRAHLVSK